MLSKRFLITKKILLKMYFVWIIAWIILTMVVIPFMFICACLSGIKDTMIDIFNQFAERFPPRRLINTLKYSWVKKERIAAGRALNSQVSQGDK